MGITGYILSNIIADGVTALTLFAALRLWRYLNPPGAAALAGRQYVPLLPAAHPRHRLLLGHQHLRPVFHLLPHRQRRFWPVRVVAGKVSMALLTVSGIFTDAWQLSIASDRSREEKGRFFSNVFSVFEAGVLSAARGADCRRPPSSSACSRPRAISPPGIMSRFWCWGRLSPASVPFSSSVYTSEMRTSATFMTTLLGAAANPCGERPLDPPLGGDGGGGGDASEPTFSFLIFRAAHSHRLLPLPLGRLAVYSRDGGDDGRVPADGDGAVCGGGRLLRRCPPIVLPPDGQGAEKRRFGSGADKTAGINCRAQTRSGAEAFRLPGWSRGNGAWPAAFGSRRGSRAEIILLRDTGRLPRYFFRIFVPL